MNGGDLSYKIGSFEQFVPQFLPDTVVIRPFGEYGMALGGYWTKLGGSYSVNANSYLADPNSSPMADLIYLVQNDLKLLPAVKRVLIAIYWYTSNDVASWKTLVGPAIGPEVQSWNWAAGDVPPIWQVGSWSRANAYWLKNNHQVWPTPEDTTLVAGIKYLQGQGYQVGILPINALIANNYYYANGGEWEIDRSNRVWNNNTELATYLTNYQSFIQHYIDLCANNNINPWLFSIGSGLRDLMTVPDRTQFIKVINLFQQLLLYAKAKLPNAATIYFADLDEYYIPYSNAPAPGLYPGYLDSLWVTPELDYVGVNWFAPLSADDSTDITLLQKNVLRGEGYDYSLANFNWRGSPYTDRLISLTTNNFKTGLKQVTINPQIQGVKAIAQWLTFNHYSPRVLGTLAGCSPPSEITPILIINPLMCSNLAGNAAVLTDDAPISPDTGGIAPAPDLYATYLQIDPNTYGHFTLPATIPDNTILNFEFNFALNTLTSSNTSNYRLFSSSFGLMIDAVSGTITLQLTQSNGSILSTGLFTLWKGDIALVYTDTRVTVTVGGTFDRDILPASGLTFVLPKPSETCWIGNPPPPNTVSGYSAWSGRVYFLNFTFGADPNSGGSFYFEDSYNGVRTSWDPIASKKWIALTGYGSVHGSAADPMTRPETILWQYGASVPASYPDGAALNAAVFWNNYRIWNIQGPYGSNFDLDEIYQATVLYCAALGLESADPQNICAWFFDTRSPAGRLLTMPSTGWQCYNDAFDGELDCSLNGKAAVRYSGINLIDAPTETVDEMLGLSIMPGPMPPQRAILVEPGVPQQ
jgi:hypothetical protein